MTKEEYCERMGYKAECSDAEWKIAEKVYRETELSINAFCADYKKHKDSVIIDELMETVRILCDESSNLGRMFAYN